MYEILLLFLLVDLGLFGLCVLFLFLHWIAFQEVDCVWD